MATNGNRELTVTALILGVLLAVVFGAAAALRMHCAFRFV
jgi:uncharacterized oligopeptide transporter (OPT) family protein